jgi:hypothetical protein
MAVSVIVLVRAREEEDVVDDVLVEEAPSEEGVVANVSEVELVPSIND